MNSAISYITLPVENFEAQLEFYQQGFQFPLKDCFRPSKAGQSPYAFFDLDAITLALYPRTALAADAGIDDWPNTPLGVTLSHNVESRQKVDQLLARLVSFGARITRPAETVSWGGYRGYLTDPEGVLWEIVWSPSRHPEP
ncbi:MAG: VOC family protein [Motiliproteus sp.]|nr:VOC family protein [Motiliproteus sp.]MCW9052398.1 VOC family protein [Motiliproteus sp.]